MDGACVQRPERTIADSLQEERSQSRSGSRCTKHSTAVLARPGVLAGRSARVSSLIEHAIVTAKA